MNFEYCNSWGCLLFYKIFQLSPTEAMKYVWSEPLYYLQFQNIVFERFHVIVLQTWMVNWFQMKECLI
jgi:hypothetical protein